MYAWTRLLDAVVRARRWSAVRETLAARTRLHEWCESGGSSPTAIDAVCLESRVLYSASPLAEMFASIANDIDDDADSPSDHSGDFDHRASHLAPLFMAPSAGGATGVPTIDLPDHVTIDEDRPSVPILIRFSDSDTPIENWNIVVTSSNQSIVKNENIVVRGDGEQRSLIITAERDRFGVPVDIHVSISDGTHTTTDSFGLTINAVNDRPEAVSLPNITVLEDTSSSVINLHAAFHDVDNADNQLTYSVTEVSNPSLFSRLTLDQANGRLTLVYAGGASGTANITIRATDPSGAYVEIGPDFRPTKLYEAISAATPEDMPDTASLGIDRISLFTQWALFDLVDGEYDYSYVNYSLLERVLTNFSPAGIPVAIDIENEEYFGNTPEGRDNLAEVIRFARELRPDLEMGFYTLIPTGNWWTPMYQHRLQQDLAAGLNTWYTQNAERFNREYQNWQDANALYREAPLTNDPNGYTLADYVQNTQPSLYTPYRHFWTKTYEARNITIDPTTDRLTSPFAYENGMSVVFTRSPEDILPDHLDGSTRLYVVNANGTSFQLSTNPGGVGIDFELPGVTNSQLSRWLALEDDIDVRDWHAYAEYNVEESRKFGDLPVYGWISPSIRGNGLEYLEGEYFREQLEILSELTEGIVIYESHTQDREFHENQAWWYELTDFVEKQNAHKTWFSVNVINVDYRPVAVNDSYLVSAGGILSVGGRGFLSNDSDADSPSFWVQSVVAPRSGTLQWQTTGAFTYRNTDPTVTDDSFTYTIRDSGGLTSQATVRVHIQNEFHAPPASISVSSVRGPSSGITVSSPDNAAAMIAPLSSHIYYAPLSTTDGSDSPSVDGHGLVVRAASVASEQGDHESFELTERNDSSSIEKLARMEGMIPWDAAPIGDSMPEILRHDAMFSWLLPGEGHRAAEAARQQVMIALAQLQAQARRDDDNDDESDID